MRAKCTHEVRCGRKAAQSGYFAQAGIGRAQDVRGIVQAQLQREGRGRAADRAPKGAHESADAKARTACHLRQWDRPDRVGEKLLDHTCERRGVQPAIVPSPICIPIGSADMSCQSELQHIQRQAIAGPLRNSRCRYLGHGEDLRVSGIECVLPIRAESLFARVLHELLVELELKPQYLTPACQTVTLPAARSERD